MPLSEPVARELLHTRDIRVQGFRREDGLFDIEAQLTDRRNYSFNTPDRAVPVGDALHGMWMRMTVDSAMLIVECTASTDFGPYFECPSGAESFAGLAGLTIRPGFLKAANERVGGTAGCTHLREVLQQMATVAFQTTSAARKKSADQHDSAGAARLLNTCYAYASDGPLVRRRWPTLYTGPAEPAPAEADASGAESGTPSPQITAAGTGKG
jgi:hypothetical protein